MDKLILVGRIGRVGELRHDGPRSYERDDGTVAASYEANITKFEMLTASASS